MKMNFVESGIVAQGEYPDFVQYPDTSGQVFFIDGGRLKGRSTSRLDGDFSNPQWEDTLDVSPDSGMSNLELKTLNGFGIVGSHSLISTFYQHSRKGEGLWNLILK